MKVRLHSTRALVQASSRKCQARYGFGFVVSVLEMLLMKKKHTLPDFNTTFSFLSLDEQDKDTWKSLAPHLFNYTVPITFSGALIPDECYQTLNTTGLDTTQKEV
jgi:hypothetical protein